MYDKQHFIEVLGKVGIELEDSMEVKRYKLSQIITAEMYHSGVTDPELLSRPAMNTDYVFHPYSGQKLNTDSQRTWWSCAKWHPAAYKDYAYLLVSGGDIWIIEIDVGPSWLEAFKGLI